MFTDLKGKTKKELEKFAVSIGESPFRGRQLFKWIYSKRENGFEKMTDIGKKLTAKLKEVAYVSCLKTIERKKSETGDTEKFLFELEDGNRIEAVLMRYPEQKQGRATVCISSQVGCAQGCSFCASGKLGFIRNLTTAEIIDQVIQIQNEADRTSERVHNVVIMGIGEPLVNYDNVLKAINLINDCDGICISMRKIAVSTVGIPPLIKKLADENLPIRFAISLHAPDNETRSRIMPINRKYSIEELMDSLKYYQKITGKRITIEYTLIEGINDSVEQARKLGELIRNLHVMVNLIPLNPVKGFPYKRPSNKKCEIFSNELQRYKFHAPLRVERGVNISAACGQLRLQNLQCFNE
ncbi:MAG: 23S rRNA (adenine(2503)-C(2))-methyltransferase RlmN [Vulcanimicrobiota bacterium]